MVISEEQLRAYVKCSEYYHREGIVEKSFPLRLVEHAVEKTILSLLKTGRSKSASDLQGILVNSIGQVGSHDLLEPQVNHYLNIGLIWLKEFFSIINLENYIPIYGPTKPRTKISKTPIEFKVSAVLRSKKSQTLHLLIFTPGATKHYMKNDPVPLLAINAYKHLVKTHQSNRPQVIAHCFGYGKNNNLNYYTVDSNEFDETKLERITSLVKGMEAGFHYPVLPCFHKCKFKKECY